MSILMMWVWLSTNVVSQSASQDPRQFAVLRTGVTCDRGQNHQVFLGNRHTSRDITATVRWRVAGGRHSTASFRVAAGAEEQIGCASDASIVRASYLPTALPSNPAAQRFVLLRFGATCDRGQNAQVLLVNRHTSRDINVTIRWRVSGQPYRTATFRINAGAEQQVGCAADAQIAGASYLTSGGGAPTPPRPGPAIPPASVAMKHAAIRFGRFCGRGSNNTVSLSNTHPSRSLVVTVRSRVKDGVSRTDTYRVAARSTQPIGCAAEASVTAARFQ